MNNSKIKRGRTMTGFFLSLSSVAVLLIGRELVALVPVDVSSFTELAVQILPEAFSFSVLTTGIAIIASNGTKGGFIRGIGKSLVAISGVVLLISYVNLVLMLILLLAPINSGALILGFGLILLLGLPLIKPTAKFYLEVYRSF